MRIRKVAALVAALTLAMTAVAVPAQAKAKDAPGDVVADGFGFVLGLADGPGDKLLVADASSGVYEVHKGKTKQVSDLPGISDVLADGGSHFYALLGENEDGTGGKLLRVSKKKVEVIADLQAFEEANDPFGGEVLSNPYGIDGLSKGRVLVADAAANDLLIVDKKKNVDWVAVFPAQVVPTDHLPPLPFPLPPEIPAEPVPTSVAVGPDGAYYVGELSGFPSRPGASRIWRIEPGTLHAECGTDPRCTVVATGFTSIVDMAFGDDGLLYVVELTESGWLIAELAPEAALPGTLNAVNVADGTSTEVATLVLPTAVAIGKKGAVYATQFGLVPGAAQVVRAL